MKPVRRPLFTILLGLPVAIGLVGAFVGLGRSSFWYDELFTAWVVKSDHNPVHVFDRILTDLHPPVYYFTTYLYSQVFGDSDAALRSYSALAASGAALIVVFGLQPVLRLNSRLLAAALMVGSRYWFYMSQNARSYALCGLIGTIMLWAVASLLTDVRNRWQKVGVVMALALLGAFSHYFMTFEAVALCLILALYLPPQRIALLIFALVLVGLTSVYVRYVVGIYSQFSPTHTWMSNDIDTYVSEFGDVMQSLDIKAVAIFLLCLFVFVIDLYAERLKPIAKKPDLQADARVVLRSFLSWLKGFDQFAAICLVVPFLVLAFSIASSLLRPNFDPQNYLLVAPFIWCGCARLYEITILRTQPHLRLAINSVILTLAIGMSGVVGGRFVARNEPWKESASAVQTFTACRGQVIPVVSEDGPYLRNPHFPEMYAPYIYGYYLHGFAPTKIFELTDIDKGRLPIDIHNIIATRLKGGGCPILAWSAHTPPDHYADTLMPELTSAVGEPAPGYHLEKREYYFYDQVIESDKTTNPAFIIVVAPGPAKDQTTDHDKG